MCVVVAAVCFSLFIQNKPFFKLKEKGYQYQDHLTVGLPDSLSKSTLLGDEEMACFFLKYLPQMYENSSCTPCSCHSGTHHTGNTSPEDAETGSC